MCVTLNFKAIYGDHVLAADDWKALIVQCMIAFKRMEEKEVYNNYGKQDMTLRRQWAMQLIKLRKLDIAAIAK